MTGGSLVKIKKRSHSLVCIKKRSKKRDFFYVSFSIYISSSSLGWGRKLYFSPRVFMCFSCNGGILRVFLVFGVFLVYNFQYFVIFEKNLLHQYGFPLQVQWTGVPHCFVKFRGSVGGYFWVMGWVVLRCLQPFVNTLGVVLKHVRTKICISILAI